jgi:hypothetical protein
MTSDVQFEFVVVGELPVVVERKMEKSNLPPGEASLLVLLTVYWVWGMPPMGPVGNSCTVAGLEIIARRLAAWTKTIAAAAAVCTKNREGIFILCA